MSQGRREDQEQSAYVFCGLCLLAVVGMLCIGAITHDGGMFPWFNILGLIGLGMTVKVAGVLL